MFKKQGASIGPLALLIKPLVAKIGAKIFAKGVGKSLAKNVAKKAVTNAVSKGKDDSQVESSQLAQASPASGNKEGGNEKAASSGYSGSAMYDNYNGSSMNAGFVKLPLEVQKNILKNKK